MVLFVLHKLILQTRMRTHPVGLDVWFLFGPFVYFHTSCVRTAMALARLCGCTGSPEPSLVAYVISTIISWAGSINELILQASVCWNDLICFMSARISWKGKMRRSMTKPTNWCAPSKVSDQPGHPSSLIRAFAVCMKKPWVLSYPLSAQSRLWSDWAVAQADLSLCWAQTILLVLSCCSSDDHVQLFLA